MSRPQYERQPKEVRYETPDLKGKVDWDNQLEKRSARCLQKKNKQK